MIRAGILTIAGVLMAGSGPAASQTASTDLFGNLRPGTHGVGYRLIMEADSSRPALPDSPAKDGRIMPISVWYPSRRQAPGVERLRVADYVRVSGQALSGRVGDDGLTAFRQRYRDATAHTIEKLLATAMLAVREAAPAPGRFPLVLFAHAAPDSQSIMAEFLASHGFVVAAVRSRGTTELPYTLSRENLDTMTADLEFTWARLQREPGVRTGRAAFIGMSNGSIGAMAVQLRQPSIVAGIVSLDGGIGEDAGGMYLRERSGNQPTRFRAPVLHLYTEPNRYLNLDHLRAFEGADRTLVLVKGMRHADFLNDAQFDRFLSGTARTRHAAEGFTWVARYTRRFLQWVFANGRADWLEGEAAASELVTILRLPATAAERRPPR